MAEPGDANRRWAQMLGDWAIPEQLVAAAREPPYFFDPQVFIAAANQDQPYHPEGHPQCIPGPSGNTAPLRNGCGLCHRFPSFESACAAEAMVSPGYGWGVEPLDPNSKLTNGPTPEGYTTGPWEASVREGPGSARR
jgi:hypothetical protein